MKVTLIYDEELYIGFLFDEKGDVGIQEPEELRSADVGAVVAKRHDERHSTPLLGNARVRKARKGSLRSFKTIFFKLFVIILTIRLGPRFYSLTDTRASGNECHRDFRVAGPDDQNRVR